MIIGGGGSISGAAYTSGAAVSSPSFPRLGGMYIGGNGSLSQNYATTGVKANIAKLDMAILGMYHTWTGGAGGPVTTPSAAVAAIKTINPSILLGNYTIFQQIAGTMSTESSEVTSQVGPGGIGNWNAYNAAGSSVGQVNLTLLVTPNSNGDCFPQFAAKADSSLVIGDGATWDIWYSDNNFWQPRVTADWNRSGTNRGPTDATARGWWRAGQAAYYTQANALKSTNQMLMVNADSDLGGGVYPPGEDVYTQYQNLSGGAFLEAMIGETWSAESVYNWADMMGWYHTVFGQLTSPQMVLFNMHWDTPNSDYQTARYALASCLMDNGYFSISDNGSGAGSSNYDPNTFYWLDEFNLTGGSTTKWLGTAVDPPQTTAWSSGVLMRRFTNGMALVNPKGNGSKTVTPPSGYTHFTGTQASSTNNGAAVTGTVTLADRDGLLLVKTGTNGY